MEGKFAFGWSHGVPFGWNSFSALSAFASPQHWRETAAFLRNELPHFRGSEETAFINLDATFGLDEEELSAVIDECHAQGQKVGNYLAPLTAHPILELFPPRGSPDKTRMDAALTLPDGRPYPTVGPGVSDALVELVDVPYSQIRL